MKRLREAVAGKADFVYTCEFVPGRGWKDGAVDAAIQFGEQVLASRLPIHAISITDNPGGNPAISPDVLARELKQKGLDVLVHFSGASLNRNAIESRASALARDGLDSVLVITGDYPTGGFAGTAQPVFDMDSVQITRYLKAMNEGIRIPGRKPGTFDVLPRTDFFLGVGASPFKRTPEEQWGQYIKLEKKIAAGADFVIPQLGYNVLKFAELLKYLRWRGTERPILGNVYVLSRAAGRAMHGGHVPGCVVPDSLMQKLDEEFQAPDKGKGARLERAAQMVAISKGMGLKGVHIGGFALKCDDIAVIISRAAEIGDNWRDYIAANSFGVNDQYTMFPPDPELRFSEEACSPIEPPRKRVFAPSLSFSRFVHWLAFRGKGPVSAFAKAFYGYIEKHPGAGAVVHTLEKRTKQIMFDCQECGDCALFDLAYICPMALCAKHQRNGPCGGSCNGMCESRPEHRCYWAMVYDRASAAGITEKIRAAYVPPVNHELHRTSSWSNFFLGKDHTSKAATATKQGAGG